MNKVISVGIVGYGNLGRGVEKALRQNPDFRLEAIFTRRKPVDISADTTLVHLSEIEKYKELIDVLILCGGSATDLPEQGPSLAAMFHTVDSFDTHANIPQYFNHMDEVARTSGHVGIISTGWDPGLFSLYRALGEAVLPEGNTYTFWGKGLSQGHSDALRTLDGVKNGVQYTIPNEQAMVKVRAGEQPQLSTRDKHRRQCYVVAEDGVNLTQLKQRIQAMPHYFADYETEVIFISEEELQANHASMPHGGVVFRSGKTGETSYSEKTEKTNNQLVEFGLKLDSNPEFTSSVLVAYARAAYRLAEQGQFGAKTVLDIPLGYLSPKSPEQLRKELL